jgi:hypothetical protein
VEYEEGRLLLLDRHVQLLVTHATFAGETTHNR